ncbi:hypothetical protein DN388_15895 [Pseudomonas sp. S12(2018)]|uniref:hypothetical protein n=1 Tax=Pseudomonas sp. S12(2018) TaxID=2219664 RepID=UPI0020CC2122|nr:hypothetical protein [Pseudomonas sp. S12(2018)]MCQ0168439.1 hypothetical protein [Pseudomonas sp. S12(2018)]
MSDERFTLSQDGFTRCFVNGWIVDARDGGLIVGRSHQNGHILMFQGTPSLGEFEHIGYVEGGEYIMSTGATESHMARLEEINRDNAPCDTEVPISLDSQIINTRAEPHDKFLVIEKQFIINRNATKRHFVELEKLNSAHRFHNGRVLSDEIIEAISQPGFVKY